MGSDEEMRRINDIIQDFPATFQLLRHEGTFRISGAASYFTGPGECGGVIMLYTQVQRTPEEYLKLYGRPHRSENDLWVDFCKGTERELRGQVVR